MSNGTRAAEAHFIAASRVSDFYTAGVALTADTRRLCVGALFASDLRAREYREQNISSSHRISVIPSESRIRLSTERERRGAGYLAIRSVYGDNGSIGVKPVLTSSLAISCCPFALA